MIASDEISLKNSLLLLEGTQEEQDKISAEIDTKKGYLTKDQSDRKGVYTIRRDFYLGNQGKYTNIVGLKNKEKEGHSNAVFNYAGKTAQKISQSMANNPPNITYPVDPIYKPDDPDYEVEDIRTQSVEDSTEMVFRENKFWKRGYRRAAFNQSIVGDYAFKVYPCNIGTKDKPEWDIKIVSQEKIENLMVGWRGDDAKEFDYVICEELKSIQSIKEEWNIDIPLEMAADLQKGEESKTGTSNHNNNQWGTKAGNTTGRALYPTGENTIPSVHVWEYDDETTYAIKIEGKLVQYVKKDDVTYPKMKFWVIGENVPNPGFHWSISDIDYLMDANIELNEASNEERDYIRVGANQKYVATNMSDFDPESIKTGSGGVIFVDSPDGNSKFEPLTTNVNTYSADQYLTRVKKHIHDFGIPEVGFGSAGSDSGRSKALDYQSIIDLLVFKRDSFELVLDEVCAKIQKLLYFYFKSKYFEDAKTGKFKARYTEFDWSDIVPITQSDKIVNVVNKVQMGLPFELAFKELGYKDVDAVIAAMKQEAKDPELMMFRSKMFQASQGLATAMQQNAPQAPPAGNPNGVASGPTLVTSQNSGGTMPMSQDNGTTAAMSTANGVIKQAQQNVTAQTQ